MRISGASFSPEHSLMTSKPLQIASSRLFPGKPTLSSPVTTPLSILDSAAGRFSPTGAIWIYDKIPESASDDKDREAKFISELRSSFVTTLGDFPQWAGQLHMAQQNPSGGDANLSNSTYRHTDRFNRARITYGTPEDPGVEWTVVRLHDWKPEDIAPTPDERASRPGAVWIADDFHQSPCLSSRPLALHDLRDFKGLPAMQVQISLLAAGGYAIGVKLSHLLADAQSLLVFMNRWSANARGAADEGPRPVFDPSMLDAAAAGDIDAAEPNPKLVEEARSLPQHRFDWFAQKNPSAATQNSKPPGLETMELSPGYEIPWETWDTKKPVVYSLVHFSREEVEGIRTRITSALGQDPERRHERISKLDALLAHIWAAINRARLLSDSKEQVFLDLSVGARTRTDPPLPETFLGSPLFNMHIGATGSEASTSPAQVSLKVRQSTSKITPSVIGAMLHDAAFEVSPQRLWNAFLGSRHLLVTSWLRLNVYDVKFDSSGQRPRYVHAVMNRMDGLVQIMDAGTEQGGVDVAVYLEKESMGRLLAGLELHGTALLN